MRGRSDAPYSPPRPASHPHTPCPYPRPPHDTSATSFSHNKRPNSVYIPTVCRTTAPNAARSNATLHQRHTSTPNTLKTYHISTTVHHTTETLLLQHQHYTQTILCTVTLPAAVTHSCHVVTKTTSQVVGVSARFLNRNDSKLLKNNSDFTIINFNIFYNFFIIKSSLVSLL